MKKFVSLSAAILFFVLCFSFPASAETKVGDEFAFGAGLISDLPDDFGEKAGEDLVFKLQYTTETNNGGNAYDTSLIGDQIYGSNTAFSAWFGDMWCPPDAALVGDADFESGNFWWLVDATGVVSPAGSLSQVVSFTVPDWEEAVNIYFDLCYEIGIDPSNQDDTDDRRDGVSLTVQVNDTVIFSDDSGANEYVFNAVSLKDGADLELVDGDVVYFIIDGNEYQDYDFGKMIISGGAWYPGWEWWDDFSFGLADREEGEDLTEQGQNGFYSMYSNKWNMGENVDLSSFKECALNGVDSSWAGYYESLWTPVDDFVNAANNWFKIVGSEGAIMPGTNKTAALKWVAPAAGVYDLSASVRVGSPAEVWGLQASGDPLAADGQALSIYVNGELVFFGDADKPLGVYDWDYSQTGIELKKGDEIYFVADEKVISDVRETNYWNINISVVELDDVETEPGTSTTTPVDTNPETGAVMPVAIIVCAVLVSGAFVLAASRKMSRAK